MKIKDLIDNNSKIDIEYLKTIPEFNKLSECEQNPKWHSEGNVMNHTLLALEKFETEIIKSWEVLRSLSDIELKIIRISIVLHDIGKGVSTFMGKDGNWHAYGHEVEGEKIARFLLWDEDFKIRETICSLIRYHMEPLKLFDSKNWVNKIIEIGNRIEWKLLYYVKMADLLGSIQINGGTTQDDLKKLELIKKTAIALGLWENSNLKMYNDILPSLNDREMFPWKIKTPTNKAYIMIGLPGSGKNTYVENKLTGDNIVCISRDDIRIELGYCNEGEKYVGTNDEEKNVTDVYFEKLNKAIENGKDVVLNDMNIKRKYRDILTKYLRKNGYKILFVYVEAPTLNDNIKRRQGQIKSDIITKLVLSFEYPESVEYDKMIISKQTW
jgi:predicted kinase